MSRKLLFVIAIGVVLLGPWSSAAQAAEKTVAREPGQAVGSEYGEPLTSSAAADPTGHLPVYGGMALVGLTLAVVSLQRWSTTRSGLTSGAALAYRPRADAETWTTGGAERVTAAAAPPGRS